MFDVVDYTRAIILLKRGITQLQPDGKPCAICGDNGHQAFECHHNPLTAKGPLNVSNTLRLLANIACIASGITMVGSDDATKMRKILDLIGAATFGD